jgi:hypothetical protein
MNTLKSMDPQVLRALINSTLSPIGLYSLNAEELLMATCANESNLGMYRTQGNGGPARGIFQMEGATHDDIWHNYIAYHSDLTANLHKLSSLCTANDMINNDPYAVAMCRVHYLRGRGALPDSTDLEGIWAYYKLHYNTPQGAATHDEFIIKYHKYVADSN